MTFQEMRKKYDLVNAYDGFVTIAEAKELGIIPERFYSAFPEKCVCGSDNIISVGLQQPQCCDPRCYVKQGYAMANMFSRFGYQGLGAATCKHILAGIQDKFEDNSYMEVLNIKPTDLPSDMWGTVMSSKLFYAINGIRETSVTFPQLIKLIDVPYIGDTAETLLHNINTIEELIDGIYTEGLARFCLQRGVGDVRKMFWLYASIADIYHADMATRAHRRRQGLVPINVCITGSLRLDGNVTGDVALNGSITKNDFIKLCNGLARIQSGEQIFEIRMCSAVESVPYIIADAPSGSRKYKAGLRRGKNSHGEDILITSSEFIAKILKAVDEIEKKCSCADDKNAVTHSETQDDSEIKQVNSF